MKDQWITLPGSNPPYSMLDAAMEFSSMLWVNSGPKASWHHCSKNSSGNALPKTKKYEETVEILFILI